MWLTDTFSPWLRGSLSSSLRDQKADLCGGEIAGGKKGKPEQQKQWSQRGPALYITELACGDCAMRCSCLGWCKQSLSASGGPAMCLDAAVMGTCPTFINQSWKKRKQRDGEWRRRRGEWWEGMPSELARGGREKSFRGKEGRCCGGGRLNKAHIDVPNTAASVSWLAGLEAAPSSASYLYQFTLRPFSFHWNRWPSPLDLSSLTSDFCRGFLYLHASRNTGSLFSTSALSFVSHGSAFKPRPTLLHNSPWSHCYSSRPHPMAEDKERVMMTGSVTLQIHATSAGLLGNVQSSRLGFLQSVPGNKEMGLDTTFKLTPQVWTYLVNLKLNLKQ